jgi:hypothetical protein
MEGNRDLGKQRVLVIISSKQNDIEMIRDNNEAIKLDTINGTVNAKKILSVNGKHVVFVDQYGNVKEALLK